MNGARAERHWAEAAARGHLEKLGYRHLASNYRLRGGELDLVMEDGSVIVVVEVKQRKDARFGHPLEAIDARKLRRLRRAAMHYAQAAGGGAGARLRLDAVVLLGDEGGYSLQHVRDVGW
ncbi:MAG: YraN family protein [Trueperaceae bacterium]|nr:YraN family protein [Trueperaceae bacterium]MCO5173798.1 YraN family protein [Trueperaceae bacterium]MCW5818990.1 YraN family protein [Trueperaceae bacterium]